MKAVDRWVPVDSSSTCATWWVRQGFAGVAAGRTIRLPVHVIERSGSCAMWALTTDWADPSPREQRFDERPLAVELLLEAARPASSLETPIGEGDGTEIGDLVQDVSARSPKGPMDGQLAARSSARWRR
jgi:RNA polymerase primary sigma factor